MVILCVVLGLGLAFVIIFSIGQYLILDSLRFELEEYLDDCREVERIADPRIKPHYKAVANRLSGLLSKYFPEN